MKTLLFVLVLIAGACCQQDAVVYRTLGGSFVFRVGCIETITCAGIGDRARWTTGSGALLNEIQNTSDLFITTRVVPQPNGKLAQFAELTFNPVKIDHDQSYDCGIFVGSVAPTRQFNVDVNPNPLEIVSVNSDSDSDLSSLTIGHNFTIECIVGTCYDNLAVSFFKGGDVLRTIRTPKNIERYTHTFALDESSAGVYGCKVDTANGSVFPKMFTLKGVPRRS